MRVQEDTSALVLVWLTSKAWLTPKALTNSSPGFELARTLGSKRNKLSTLKALAKPVQIANAFSVANIVSFGPRVLASSNPGLELVNAFGVRVSHAGVLESLTARR